MIEAYLPTFKVPSTSFNFLLLVQLSKIAFEQQYSSEIEHYYYYYYYYYV